MMNHPVHRALLENRHNSISVSYTHLDVYKRQLLNKKVKKAIEAGLTPILCCGETLEQRESGVTLDWIRLQIKSDLAGCLLYTSRCV